MAVWNQSNVLVTEKGQELLSLVQSGEGSITITKVLSGGGRVPDSQLYTAVSVSEEKQELSIVSKDVIENGSVINLQLDNTTLTESYELNQIGVYASHPDLGEILYMLGQCDDNTGDVIPLPSISPVILNYGFYLVHGKDSTIEVSINPSGMVTNVEFNQLKSNLETILPTKADLDPITKKVPESQLPDMTPKDDSITTAKITNGAVTDVKLASNAVTTAKIQNGAVTLEKIANGVLTAENTSVAGAYTLPSGQAKNVENVLNYLNVNKENLQHMIDDWRTEESVDYSKNSTTIFRIRTAWDNGNILVNSIITTEVGNDTNIKKQYAFRSNDIPLKYRLFDTSNLKWGEWETIATQDWVAETFSNPNLSINGGFDIWNNGTTIAMNSGELFLADKWQKAGATLVGCYAKKKIISGIGNVLEIDCTNGTGNFDTRVIQSIDLSNTKQKFTLSFLYNLEKVDISFRAYTGDTPDYSSTLKSVGVETNILGYYKHVNTFNVTSSSEYLRYLIGNAGLTEKKVYHLAQVKLELGEVATPFVPKPYVEELQNCLMYNESGEVINPLEAKNHSIEDINNNFTSNNVEGALKELAEGKVETATLVINETLIGATEPTTGTFKFYKTGKVVQVIMNIDLVGIYSGNTILTKAEIPIGFRPRANCSCLADFMLFAISVSVIQEPVYVWLDNDGGISFTTAYREEMGDAMGMYSLSFTYICE